MGLNDVLTRGIPYPINSQVHPTGFLQRVMQVTFFAFILVLEDQLFIPSLRASDCLNTMLLYKFCFQSGDIIVCEDCRI